MGVAAILVMWPNYFATILHEIRVWLCQWFVRKLHVYFNILMGLQFERPKLKGQPWLLNLFIAIAISSENND